MNSLRALLSRPISQRFPNLLTAAGGVTHWSQPHFGRHTTSRWQFSCSSTKSDKKPKAGKKSELTEQEKEERRKNLEEKRKRLVKRFNKFIGKRELNDWQKLCRVIDLKGQFNDIDSCRKVLYTSALDSTPPQQHTVSSTQIPLAMLLLTMPLLLLYCHRPSNPYTSISWMSLTPTKLFKPGASQSRSDSRPPKRSPSLP